MLSALLLSLPRLLAHPTTDDAFIAAWKKAVETKDQIAIEKLTYLEGLTQENRSLFLLKANRFSNIEKVKEVTLKALPSDYSAVHVVMGRKSELLKTPVGLIKVTGQGAYSYASPYTVIEGKYYVVGSKITDLNWQGPPDVILRYNVEGKGSENVEIEYSWNASGVDMTKSKISSKNKYGFSNSSFPGQHISWFKVTSNDPDSEIVLVLSEGEKETYKSVPLKGLGIIEYKKPN